MPPSDQEYLQNILTSNVYEVAEETPLDFAQRLSERLQNKIWLKREDLQPVHSFKLRGAYNKIAQLTSEVRSRGVITASAGNHAQGVALAAQRFSCPALIVMPTTTPDIKVQAVKARGAAVILFGDSYSDAEAHAQQLATERRLTFIHPYDDPAVIAGQGTVAVEIFKQLREPLTAIFVSIGGGGLISGIALYARSLFPDVKIIGVEPVEAPSMQAAIEAGQPVSLPSVGVFADGVAVRKVGEETFRICQKFVDQIILVDNDEICAAIKDVFEDTRAVLEPAGAVSVAGLKKYLQASSESGGAYVAIASGSNINFSRLRHVAERADIGEAREAVLAVTIPEEPGSFRKLIDLLGTRTITEFNYRYTYTDAAHVFLGLAIVDLAEREKLIEHLRSEGLSVLDLSSNETAKLHVRHMVGGCSPLTRDERIFRFNFPERPGALRQFLISMNPEWNISLFHYRNHGADLGRVLVGIQAPAADRTAVEKFLTDLGYEFFEETSNPACALFL